MATEKRGLNPQRTLKVKPRHVSISSKGVVLEGKAASEFATLLIHRNADLVDVLKGADETITAQDIFVDESGRVIFRSARLQKIVFEGVRLGVDPANPRGLGRLVARSGGRIGPRRLGKSPSVEDPKDPPPFKGETHLHEVNFMCRGDDGLDMLCGKWDEILEKERTECNWFCGWGS